MQRDFVAALVSCAEGPKQSGVRRFLQGLSCDELEFLATFLGAVILEAAECCPCSRAQLAERIAELERSRFTTRPTPDQDHKMILLLEFLCRSGLPRVPVTVRASHA